VSNKAKQEASCYGKKKVAEFPQMERASALKIQFYECGGLE
jgi:hypothetical protein